MQQVLLEISIYPPQGEVKHVCTHIVVEVKLKITHYVSFRTSVTLGDNLV